MMCMKLDWFHISPIILKQNIPSQSGFLFSISALDYTDRQTDREREKYGCPVIGTMKRN